MVEQNNQVENVINALQERARELNLIYRVEELLQDYDADLRTVLEGVVNAIPPGWQHSDVCQARITYGDARYQTPGFEASSWVLSAKIRVEGEVVGTLEVSYKQEMPTEDGGPFLKEEKKLINTLADRIGHFIRHKHLKRMFQDMKSARDKLEDKSGKSEVITELLLRTDLDLFIRISRKMLNYLHRNGIPEAETILQRLSSDKSVENGSNNLGLNLPTKKKQQPIDILELSKETFKIAAKSLSDKEIISQVQKWMQEDKAGFLVKALNDPKTTLDEIADKLRRFQQLSAKENIMLSESIHKSIRVQLIRKIISGQLGYIKIAKRFVDLEDFFELFPKMIYTSDSHGRLGGKGSGLFVASQVIKKESKNSENLKNVRVPKTFFITSDGLQNFVHYNDLEDVLEQKYKDIGQVRQEYSQIVEIFKNSKFPPEIIRKLSVALDELGNSPLIVRSSSLLEDQLGSAFSGKYNSFFLGNQGRKEDRLEALMDAIAEVYASTFSPDPIEYRAERDLLDSQEEMGVLIQEVVGTKVGPYFLPAYAGVAFSNNEFRWSPRIKRDDGLIRLVPGLGTRAVDRLSDDYPILVAPGQPGLRVNVTQEEIIRYSPNKIDVINLKKNSFETIEVVDFIRECGEDFEPVHQLISIVKDRHIQRPSIMNTDFETCDPVVTFEGLIQDTSFVKQMREILTLLQEKFGVPVDIEFASDGKHFYLLQCRPQGYGKRSKPVPIPKDIPEEAIVFSANRYISNGHVPDITHIVYVDPKAYSEISDKQKLIEVGRAVGKLNVHLPKHQFILMGPGRWGSRGDIKLGVNVTYSDINNTAVLIEIARKKGNYLPDLSFGTHFFQDLVESEIRYLPLYPDDEGIIFNERFLLSSRSILSDILPEYKFLDNTLRVIDILKVTRGKVLRIYLNAELDEAVGILSQPSKKDDGKSEEKAYAVEPYADDHWRWRLRMAENIASNIDPERFGLKAFYIFGSTKNGTAGPGSDIDLLLHFTGSEEQKKAMFEWLEGWSLCLDEMNYLRTGYRSNGLLDVHLVTDEDIANRSSYAIKIGAVTDAAREIPLNRKLAAI